MSAVAAERGATARVASCSGSSRAPDEEGLSMDCQNQDLARRWLMRWPFTWPNDLPDIDGSSPVETGDSAGGPEPSEAQGTGTASGLAIDPMFPLSSLMRSSIAQAPAPLPTQPSAPGVIPDGADIGSDMDHRAPASPRFEPTPDWVAPATPRPRIQIESPIDPNLGVPVTLPSGDRIPDPKSPTGHVMSPVDDLAAVATAGRNIGEIYRSLWSANPAAATASRPR